MEPDNPHDATDPSSPPDGTDSSSSHDATDPSGTHDTADHTSPQAPFEGSGHPSEDGSGNGRTAPGSVALSFDDVLKRYESGEQTVTALEHVDLRIETGEFVTVMGPSGSGKSTMLNLLGLLDEPTEGTVRIDGEETADLTDDERTQLRKDRLGFVFQDFYLLPTLTAVENVTLPTIFGDGDPARDRAADLLERVGLGDRLEHDPSELSGGQQQRVAIARSLINEPRIVLADEPTGNLDRTTSRQVLDVLSDVSGGSVSVVAVTHDELVTEYTDRTVQLVDGRIDSNGREDSRIDSNGRESGQIDSNRGDNDRGSRTGRRTDIGHDNPRDPHDPDAGGA